MKIGVNSRPILLGKTGIPYYVESLYRQLVKLDPEDKYLFFQPSTTEIIGETLIVPRGSSLIDAARFDLVDVAKLTAESAVDVLHCPAHIAPWRKPRNVKLVVTVHDLAFRRFPKQYGWFFNYYYSVFLPRALKKADKIVAVSQHTAADLQEYYDIPQNRVRVIYAGIKELFFATQQKQRPVNERYFLHITTHPRRKNTFGVIDAFASVAEHFPDVSLMIAGFLSEKSQRELIRYIEDRSLTKRVKFLGFVDENELPALYKFATAFIYPSFYEGFGFPILEAMASGTVVITADNSSLKELCPNDHWRIAAEDMNGLGRLMNESLILTNTQRHKLVAANQEFASKFRWATAAKQYIELFKSLK